MNYVLEEDFVFYVSHKNGFLNLSYDPNEAKIFDNLEQAKALKSSSSLFADFKPSPMKNFSRTEYASLMARLFSFVEEHAENLDSLDEIKFDTSSTTSKEVDDLTFVKTTQKLIDTIKEVKATSYTISVWEQIKKKIEQHRELASSTIQELEVSKLKKFFDATLLEPESIPDEDYYEYTDVKKYDDILNKAWEEGTQESCKKFILEEYVKLNITPLNDLTKTAELLDIRVSKRDTVKTIAKKIAKYLFTD